MNKQERQGLVREMSAAEAILGDAYLDMCRCLRRGSTDFTVDTRPRMLYVAANLGELGIGPGNMAKVG